MPVLTWFTTKKVPKYPLSSANRNLFVAFSTDSIALSDILPFVSNIASRKGGVETV